MRLYFTLIFSIICVSLSAQHRNGYKDYRLPKAIEVLNMPLQDNASLRQAELRSRKKGRPDCFAKNLSVNVNPHQVGTWDYTETGIAVWRYKIVSQHAATLNLGFTEYDMPSTGKLFLYGSNKNKILGPFTKSDNADHQQLWTPIIEGEEVTIELQISEQDIAALKLRLQYVNHDFMNILKSGNSSSSGSCNVDVVCGEEDGFPLIDTKRDIINSVGAFTLNGIEQCSGVLINNARNDCTPYFLTANHCEVTSSNAASVVVYWNYQNSECRQPESVESGGDGDGTFDQFSSGSSFVAGYAASDFTLLLLDDEVSPDFSPYFAGWNVGRQMPSASVCIHHPNVEEKRISIDLDPSELSVDAAEDTFIRVNSWDLGTTERGSSGAPLFNENDEIVGQLNGGLATCLNSSFDEFGPLYISWEGGGTPDTRLKDWLDPDNIGMISLPGKNCTFVLQLEDSVVEVCRENEDANTVSFSLNENFDGETTISFGELPEGLEIEIDDDKLAPGDTGSFTMSNLSSLDPDIYQIEVNADDGTNQVVSNLSLRIFDTEATSIDILSPVNGEDGLLTNVIFEWASTSDDIDIQLSRSSDFSDIEVRENILDASRISVLDLQPATEYFWRIRANNVCGVGDWSQGFSFTTGQIFCSNSLRNRERITIPDFDADTISSKIQVLLSGEIRSVEVTSIVGTHTWVGDLKMNLISPNGTVICLLDTECDDADDFSLGFSDNLGEAELSCPITDGRLYQSNDNLSMLNGEFAAGIWTLEIVDLATLDGGELESWELSICTEISTESIIYLGAEDLSLCDTPEETISIGLGLGFEGSVRLSAESTNGISATFENEIVDAGEATQLTLSDLDGLDPGEYEIVVNASDDTQTVSETIKLSVASSIISVDLLTPANGEVDASIGPVLTWDDDDRGTSYLIQISTNENFTDIILEETSTTNSFDVDDELLAELTEYYWRVASGNDCGARVSPVFSFITETIISTFELGESELTIYPNPASSFIRLESPISISTDLSISIIDLSGRVIQTNQLQTGSKGLEINTRNFASGVYFFQIENEQDRHVEKILIQN